MENNSIIMKRISKENVNNTVAPKKAHWSNGLLASMQDPDLKVKEDELIVAIKDKYPKAKYHFLVLPKADIPSIWSVEKEHCSLLLHMHKVAEELTNKYKDHEFIIGYHAMPSMQRLHLHVISTDFVSPCLKTKYHWNSFTTPFFLHSKDICDQLQNAGELKKVGRKESYEYLNTPLRCHKCSKSAKNMPQLKEHLLTHCKK